MHEQARSVHRGDRPEVWLNCAVSMDGRLAFAGGRRALLSSQADLIRVQELRADVDAIVVGVGTVLADDPSLRVHWDLLGRPPGKPPARLVLDSRGRTPEGARVLDGTAPTIVATSDQCTRSFGSTVSVVRAGADRVELPLLFPELLRRGARRLLVEGGAEVLSSFVRGGLFDRWTVYYAPFGIGGSTAPPMLAGPETHETAGVAPLRLVSVERLGEGSLATYVPGPLGATAA